MFNALLGKSDKTAAVVSLCLWEGEYGEQYVRDSAELSISVYAREKKTLGKGGEGAAYLSYTSFPALLPSQFSFIIDFLCVDTEETNEPPLLFACTHTCSPDVVRDPGLPAAPTALLSICGGTKPPPHHLCGSLKAGPSSLQPACIWHVKHPVS